MRLYSVGLQNSLQGEAPKVLLGEPGAKTVVFTHHIGLVIYLAFGLFGFMSIGGLNAKRQGEKKTPLWKKLMAIVFWPLAMIGAIEG